ncbi:hypothetical protein [Oceanobacillus luteolus]|uniref:Uncharacterized protein n=1 Tax=Oceanobacillus luteolus TaxID=1274358 RepID=A0ABW4HTB1_9BACI
MKKGKILSAAVVVGMVSNLALSSATFAQDSQLEPGTCGMTINTEVHTWSNKAQATGPCEGLVEGYYLADNGEPWLIGGVTQPVDYSGQQFVIGTPNHPYGESILTVYIESQPEEPTEPQEPVEEPEQPTEPQEPVEEPEQPTELSL